MEKYSRIGTSGPKIIFRVSLGKVGQKSFAPPKICLFLHLWHMIFPGGSVTPVGSNVWWKTPGKPKQYCQKFRHVCLQDSEFKSWPGAYLLPILLIQEKLIAKFAITWW